MQKEMLKVEGMSCNQCVKSIETALGEIGVTGKVNLQGSTVEVHYEAANVNLDKIKHTIEELGYDVV